ncbi:MBL fold metallo-hydrolase [Halodesulfovibrio sp.]|uniref:MBL fold metallo-hydrolase n=1 Tax=Halodesulfovibrio sp. TaxID=1912772 RepID=UPI0025D7CEF4|nr:MBL fold metallo-hydrolase [Halodesulfovibrio sp.]MCT4534821.1 MBL fold metallo-hydrolase [Halodesulfovibrio sp.]
MVTVHEVDSVEILSLQDNYIDALAMDNSDVIQRPSLFSPDNAHEGVVSNGPLAEHGFSSLITVEFEGQRKSMLFDFGCSDNGALYNVDLLSIDLTQVEELALSHGHFDHFGGMKQLVERVGKDSIPLVAHPSVFKDRYVRTPTGLKLSFPSLVKENVRSMGAAIHETTDPLPMLDGYALFLGEIPRETNFEKGMPNAYCLKDGIEQTDAIEDDSSMIFNVKNKGLVVLSGCAHAGIVNTVNHAISVTGVSTVHAIMGGFHLSGPYHEQFIEPTISALQAFNPSYIIPAHCTGRKATLAIERAMPEAFICNMSGTTLRF